MTSGERVEAYQAGPYTEEREAFRPDNPNHTEEQTFALPQPLRCPTREAEGALWFNGAPEETVDIDPDELSTEDVL